MIISSLSGSKPTLKRVIEDVPELGEGAQIIIQEFTGAMASEFNEALIRNKQEISTTAPEGASLRQLIMFYCSLICCSAVDAEGNRISSSKEANALLAAWDEALILRIGGIAAEINGFSKNSKEEVKKDSLPNQQQQ